MNGDGRWIDPRIRSVRVADVQAYLLGHGWRLRPYPRPELLVFEGPPADNGEPIVQVLPSSEELADFRQRVLELIAALAVIEDRPAADVLTDVLPHSGEGLSANGPGAGRASRAKAP
jgi:hypothetical protein